MATKTSSQPEKVGKTRSGASGARKLRELIDRQQILAKELLELMQELEDAEDGRQLQAAIKRNKGKPLIPWEEAKRKLGLDS